ncbi:GATA transcription factor 15-like [Cucurbita maxima]|uniref:GATA transcription factor 15-like n=1 Tax=Cucurbita maxima TaxID=3661 RepID=A0A6J1IG45_CUCMA|nr:GATA transcription factor 15-like [Cucurbita maxima]XP_022975215.1 GATA transcription factor 15-like [Cucurbita maxima]XP_022975216.1 GATA transcription factor 15-like [Cucurbita maxima]XP_022975217.1 GATA transcription factor 15-like [Cucurbita maxima]XP_022975219.1 GATA transcription factor 15-like [Cucurbita maxima]
MMMDPSDRVSESEDISSKNSGGVSSEESQVNEQNKKTCADCGTSKTPLWRGGPAGPKSLCNACGIRSRKKRRAILGLSKGVVEDKKNKRSNSCNNISNSKLRDSLKQRLMALGREVLMQRYSVERQRKKLGEEEQAAVLLMALSYGSVFA